MHVGEFVTQCCNAYPDRVAIVDQKSTLTYRELLARSNQAAHAFLSLGLGKGARVAVLTGNRREWFEVTFGLAKSGLVRTYVHPRAARDEVLYQLDDSGAKVIVVGPDHIDTIRECQLDDSFKVIELGDDYESWLSGASAQEPEVAIEDGDVVALTYTSGTTGRAKGAMWTHRTVMGHNAVHLSELDIADGEVFLHSGPLSHATSAFVLPFMYRGAKQVLRSKFDVNDVLESMVKHQVTTLMMVPTMLYMLLEALDARELPGNSVRTIIYGGSPIAPEKLKQGIAIFGPVFYGVYGATEALCSTLRKAAHDPESERIKSAGRPNFLCDVKITDPDGKELPVGEVGQINIRSVMPAIGYWKKPEATEQAWVGDGWYRGADLGKFDEEGNLYIVDRMSDLIITGGFNVYPREVEDVLLAHPHVAEAATIGLPDAKWGDSVHAVVRPMANREVTVDELREWCRPRLAGFKIPKTFTLVSADLPRSGTGKVLRRQVREDELARFGHDSPVSI